MTEREVLKLALEALEVNLGTWSAKKKAIPAIKEVLAQPEQEPVAWRYWMPVEDGHWVWNYATFIDDPKDHRCEPLYTTPPQPEPVIDKSAATRIATALGWEPKRKPLTDEDLETMAEKYVTNCYFDTLKYARAIEAAHGIKEKNT